MGADGLECLAGDVGGEPGMKGRVLLLSPCRGLGGGIERYIETLEWAFATFRGERRDGTGPATVDV
jgi:hypothetical protein